VQSSRVFRYDKGPFRFIDVAPEWNSSIELFPEDWKNLSEYFCQSPSLFRIVEDSFGTMETGPPRPPRPLRLALCRLHITSHCRLPLRARKTNIYSHVLISDAALSGPLTFSNTLLARNAGALSSLKIRTLSFLTVLHFLPFDFTRGES
jgi:hypothetical protein